MPRKRAACGRRPFDFLSADGLSANAHHLIHFNGRVIAARFAHDLRRHAGQTHGCGEHIGQIHLHRIVNALAAFELLGGPAIAVDFVQITNPWVLAGEYPRLAAFAGRANEMPEMAATRPEMPR